MKAVFYNKYGPPDVLNLIEDDKPIPGDNQIVVKIYATTVTAVDSIFRKGDAFFARLATGIFKPRNPVLGTEFSGEIEETGKDVTLFKKGDKVFGASDNEYGTYAEYICLSEDGPLTLKPENMTYEEAAAIPSGALTALPFLRDTANLKNGQSILIIGASGSVGTFAVQFAKIFGARVTGVCSTSNIKLVKSLGADKIIDYTKEDFMNNGEKYDIIFDTVGKSSFASCKNSLKQNGIYLTTVLSFSILSQMLWTSKFGNKKAKITFTGLRSFNEKIKDLTYIKELIAAGKLRAVIDRNYPLEQISEAHSYVDLGHKKGNIVIMVSQ